MKSAIWIYVLAFVLIAFSFGCGHKSDNSTPPTDSQIDLFDVMKMTPPAGSSTEVTKYNTGCEIELEYEIADAKGVLQHFRQKRHENANEEVIVYSLDQSATIRSKSKGESTTFQIINGTEKQIRYIEYEIDLDEYKKTSIIDDKWTNYAVHTKLRRTALPGFFFEDATSDKFDEKRNFGKIYDDGSLFYYQHDNAGDVLRPAQAVFKYTIQKAEGQIHRSMKLEKPYTDPENDKKKITKETRNCLTLFK